ncbi:Fc.00g027060.m01.CDS01 [Cosmosporella sp. VM-42]
MAALEERRRNGFINFLASDHNNFLVLILTTSVSIWLLYGSLNEILFSGSFFNFVTDNRPTVQFAVQILANLLSMLQIIVLCRLINFGVRCYLTRKSMELDQLRAWSDAMVPRVNWDLPFGYGLLLFVFVTISMVFSAIWAAAMTPVELWEVAAGPVVIPSWENTSLIREYPSEIGSEGLTQQTTQGRFSYSVGIQLLGPILAAGSSATPIDRGPRVHAKMDKTRYQYIGRSYGVGASAGLTDEKITDDKLALGYSYQEIGYQAGVKCIYNASSDFRISTAAPVYGAHGRLPDSDDGPEYSDYIGHSDANIVAIGVAHFKNQDGKVAPPRKYLAIASSISYPMLNATQCEIEFSPTRFNVSVNLGGRNITVTPTNETDVEDIDPSRYLKGVLLRQFELIANDETNLYVSMVGSALNNSITDFRVSVETIGNPDDLSDEDITLKGIENSITAMTDDMLGAYAAAQLMLGNFRQTTTAEVRLSALAIGERKYCIAVFAVNLFVLLLFAIEATRTRWWKGLPDFNIADVRHVVIAASEGGSDLGKAGFRRNNTLGELEVKCGDAGAGRFAIVLDGEVIKTPVVGYAYESINKGKGWSEAPPGMI